MPALASLSQADLDALAAEEAAAQAAAQGYVAEPVPAPQEALVPAGTAAPPTQTVAYPTAGPVGNTAVPYDYGQQVPSSTPVPAPQPTGGMLVGSDAVQEPAMVGADAAPTPSASGYYGGLRSDPFADSMIPGRVRKDVLHPVAPLAPPTANTGSPIFDPASPTYDEQGARASRYGAFRPGYQGQPPDGRTQPLISPGTAAPPLGTASASYPGGFDAAGQRSLDARYGQGAGFSGGNPVDVLGQFDQWSQDFFQTPQGQLTADTIQGLAGPGGGLTARVGRGFGPGAALLRDAARNAALSEADSLIASRAARTATGGEPIPRQVALEPPVIEGPTQLPRDVTLEPPTVAAPRQIPREVTLQPRTIEAPVQRPREVRLVDTRGNPLRTIEPPVELAPANRPIPEPPPADVDWVAAQEANRRARGEAWANQSRPTTPAEPVPPPSGTAAPVAQPAAVTPARAPTRTGRIKIPAKLGIGGLAAAAGALTLAGERGNYGNGDIRPANAESVPYPVQPGDYSPSTNPQTPDEWNGATTRSLEEMRTYSPESWATGTQRTPVEIGGVRQKLIESRDVPGLYVGYIDTNGNIVPVGNDVPPEEFEAMVVANAAEAPPDWGDTAGATAVPEPPAEGKTTGTSTSSTVSSGQTGTGGSGGSGSGRSSGGGGGYSGGGGSSGSGYRSGSGGYSADYSSGTVGNRGRGLEGQTEEDRDFTADDFLERAGGNRIKAQMMANMANARKRRGRVRGAPRQQSSMRDDILRAITESLAKPPRTR
jgi:uncharacterized membrane protein YgcG